MINVNEKKHGTKETLQLLAVVSVAVFFLVTFLLAVLSRYIINDYISIPDFLNKHAREIVTITLAIIVILYFFLFRNMSLLDEPKPDDPFENNGWSEEERQLKSFGKATLNLDDPIDTAGSPFNVIRDPETGQDILLYEKDPTHSLWVATTRAGKSRKIVLQLFALIIKASESAIVNDPKKELWKMSHKLFEKKGYKVHLLDFRNLKYSDCYNPMDNINYFINKGQIDDADAYADDIVESIVVDNNHGEKIWIDGQKALLKALILSVSQASMDESKKNFYSVYQSLAVNARTMKIDGQEKMILSAYIESLKEDNVARTSFAPIMTAPEKTRGSFIVSALATLRLFSSKSLMKVLCKSDFSFDDFVNGKHILFVDNPDEKSTYNSIASIVFDQAYQRLVYIATNMEEQRLDKKVHMIFDEFGNMPAINNMGSKITVALSRGIPYYFFVQDFSQIDINYGRDLGKNLRANSNFLGFISTGDMETAKIISERIGNKTIWLDNRSGNFNDASSVTGGSVSWSRSQQPLITPNNLIEQDVRNGHGILVAKTYFPSSMVFLPDTTFYPWSKEWETKMYEIEKEERSLAYAIPRYIEISPYTMNNYFNVGRQNFLKEDKSKLSYKESEKLRSEDLYWYWSMSDHLNLLVFENVIKYASTNEMVDVDTEGERLKYSLKDGARERIIHYMNSTDFKELLEVFDEKDVEKMEEEENMRFEKETRITRTLSAFEVQKIKRSKLRAAVNESQKEA